MRYGRGFDIEEEGTEEEDENLMDLFSSFVETPADKVETVAAAPGGKGKGKKGKK